MIRYDNLVWKSGLARAIVHCVLFPLHLTKPPLENSSRKKEESQKNQQEQNLSAKVVDDTPTGIDN